MNEVGASKNLDTGEIFCLKCFTNLNHVKDNTDGMEKESSNQPKFVNAESVHEICLCLKEIEFNKKQRDNCEYCENIKEATIYCENDEMFFCSECFEKCHQMKNTKNHRTKIISEKNININENNCSRHKQEKLIFCLDDQDLFCNSCESKKHSKHKTMVIDEKVEEVKNKINDQKSVLIEKIQYIFEIEEQIEEFVEILEEKRKKSILILEEIKQNMIELRETNELWTQIIQSSEITSKDWCNNKFLKKIDIQLNNIEDKWNQRLNNLNEKANQLTYDQKIHNILKMNKSFLLNKNEFKKEYGELFNNLSNADTNSKKYCKLYNSKINDKQLEYICKWISQNNNIRILDLGSNSIKMYGSRIIGEALRWNTSLITLDMRSNYIGKKGANYISEGLDKNTTLKELILKNNSIGTNGTYFLFNNLINNTSLKALNLGKNQIKDEGAIRISQYLIENSSLKSLNLSENKIGPVGAKALVESLNINKTLTYLNLKNNDFKFMDGTELIKRNTFDQTKIFNIIPCNI